MKLKVVAKNTVKPETFDEVMKLLKSLIDETRKEPGCIDYNLFQSKDNENILTFIEEWDSQESLDTHINSDHFKRIVPKLSEYMESSQIDIYKNLI